MEERASCLFVRRIAEERRRASACFSRVATPFPPPPPPQTVADASGAGSLRAQRARLGDLETYEAPRRTDAAQYAFDASGAIDGTRALISSLGETNPVLRDMLHTAVDEIQAAAGGMSAESATAPVTHTAAPASTAASGVAVSTSDTASTPVSSSTNGGSGYGYGRRLMQRKEYSTYMTDVLVTHELMQFYGKGGIPGVTVGSCQALCEATKQDERAKHTEHCNAYAFKRAAPFSYTDQTGWCYLLQNSGGCKLQDFSAELLTRQIESERQCSASAPGLDNPLCIGIPSTRDDARVLAHADAAAIAYEVPYDRKPADGSRGLPLPRTQVESMSMIAYARVNGVTAFWAASPNTEAGDVRMHWPTEGGEHLLVRRGESRCILVSSGVSPSEKMYARFRPCDAKLASGILTVAAAAAPPPPPGSTVTHWYDPRQARGPRAAPPPTSRWSPTAPTPPAACAAPWPRTSRPAAPATRSHGPPTPTPTQTQTPSSTRRRRRRRPSSARRSSSLCVARCARASS